MIDLCIVVGAVVCDSLIYFCLF